MAKTSKNKMKAWRRDAEGYNELMGEKHQGRKALIVSRQMQVPKGPTAFINNLMVRAGLAQRAPKTPDPTDTVSEIEVVPA